MLKMSQGGADYEKDFKKYSGRSYFELEFLCKNTGGALTAFNPNDEIVDSAPFVNQRLGLSKISWPKEFSWFWFCKDLLQ